MSAAVTTDTIVKTVLLRALCARVWRALTNAEEFGAWFGAQFRAARSRRARGCVAGHASGLRSPDHRMTIDAMKPERRFAWRWHLARHRYDTRLREGTRRPSSPSSCKVPGGHQADRHRNRFRPHPGRSAREVSRQRGRVTYQVEAIKPVCLHVGVGCRRIRRSSRDRRRSFAALGDVTVLVIVLWLSTGEPMSIALGPAAQICATRQAVTKHLLVLADAGLVRSERAGRERGELDPAAAARRAGAPVLYISAQWDAALGRLKRFVESHGSGAYRLKRTTDDQRRARRDR